MRVPKYGGGWQAIRYSLQKGREVGFLKLWKAMRSKNACKTCALGMGGQHGGMTNETRQFPEVCKKSLQAMTADMRGSIEPRFFETYTIEQLQGFSSRELEAAGRIVEPLVLREGDSHYRPLSWDEALAIVADRMDATEAQRTFFYCSGRSSNEAGFLLQLLARALGTNHVSNCSYYCHQASGAGLTDSIGSPTATVELDDLDKCDLLFLIGGNPASNHPRFMTSLTKLRQRGGKVVVVNPLRETGLVRFKVPSKVRSMLFGSEIASQYVQPIIGGDIALFSGIAKRLIEKRAVDVAFLEGHSEGFETLSMHLSQLSWSEIEEGSGVGHAKIEELADLYAQSEATIFAWTMGITHHEHGVQNVQWITNLALLRGMVGKNGAGLLPIRGHSNVQGLGTVGVSPTLKQAALEKLSELGLRIPSQPGYDTLSSLEASTRGEFDFALCLGGNLYGASPDSAFMKQALGNIRTLVYLSTSLNTGHVQGLGKTTLILPVAVRDEESQSTTQESMFNYVRLSDGGPKRFDGPRTEVDILASLGVRVFENLDHPLDWGRLHHHDAIRKLIANLVPNLEEIESIGETKREFYIPSRVLHEPAFKTPSGKAQLRAHAIPARPKLREDELWLMTIRSEGQFNTVVYEEEDLYRGQERRDVILMNSSDMERLGLRDNDVVRVSSATGSMAGVIARKFDIALGCAAMYYPEANILIPRLADPVSHTPAFKSAVVAIARSTKPAVTQAPNARSETESSSRDRLKAC